MAILGQILRCDTCEFEMVLEPGESVKSIGWEKSRYLKNTHTCQFCLENYDDACWREQLEDIDALLAQNPGGCAEPQVEF